MKIGQLAQLAGVNPSAIRYYERVGVLTNPERVGGQRRYSHEITYRVLLIRFAADMGFTLPEIRVFLDGLRSDAPVGSRWRNLARRKIREIEQTIERSRQLKLLLERLLKCRCVSLEMCIERLRLSPRMRLVGSNRKKVEARRISRLPDGMRRPVSHGMRAPNVSTCSRHKEKETGNAED